MQGVEFVLTLATALLGLILRSPRLFEKLSGTTVIYSLVCTESLHEISKRKKPGFSIKVNVIRAVHLCQ